MQCMLMGWGFALLHLPLLFILVTLHVQRLSIDQITAKNHCARLQEGQHSVGKQAAAIHGHEVMLCAGVHRQHTDGD